MEQIGIPETFVTSHQSVLSYISGDRRSEALPCV